MTDSQDGSGDDASESVTSSESGQGRAVAGEVAADFASGDQTHEDYSSCEAADAIIPGYRDSSDRGRGQREEE